MFGSRGVFFYSYPCPMGFFIRLILYFVGLVMGRCLWTGPGLGRAERSGSSPSFVHEADRGPPAKPILCPRSGPRPGPSIAQNMNRGPARLHQIFRGWAATRPGPSNFPFSRPVLARPMASAARSMRRGPYMSAGFCPPYQKVHSDIFEN